MMSSALQADAVLPAVEFFRQYPESVVVLAAILRAVVGWQRGLSWYEYRTIHGLRRMLFPVLDRTLGVVRFVNHKPAGRDSPEFITTVDGSIKATARLLKDGGASWHLVSSIKRRPAEHGDPLTRAHLVWLHESGDQTEAFLFKNDDGTTDVYAHHEASVLNPEAHLTEPQTDGDPQGVVTAALYQGGVLPPEKER
jgi:hypothetical protein